MPGRNWRIALVILAGLTLGPLVLREAMTQPVIQRASPLFYAHPDVVQASAHASAISLAERLNGPPRGQPNSVRIYAEDNGAGKTRVCAQFGTGIPQCFATEP